MLTNKKGVSIFILIILMLCSAVLGAFASYMMVMTSFYLESENTNLVITDVIFPVDHGDYFYVTVMNPSHSPSATNITDISFTVEGGNTTYHVTSTSPELLPIPLEAGTVKTIKCSGLWGEFAGKVITVHVSASSASGAVASVSTSFVKLALAAKFDASVSCRHFNVTLTNNAQSAISLTLKALYINLEPIETAIRIPSGENVSILGINLPNGTAVSLQCLYNWETFSNPKVRVETLEGYSAVITANATASVSLRITDVVFNEMNSDEVNITVSNSKDSSTYVDITSIVLSYNETEYVINGSLSDPPLPYPLQRDTNQTFSCVWSWRDYRNKNVTITVYTKQGYTPVSKIVPHTPGEIVFKISSSFNLTDTAHFSVNVTNMPCSLQNITVTQIKLNTNPSNFTSQTISVGNWSQFICEFNWTAFRGSAVTITVNASNTIVSQNVTLPYMLLRIINANFTATGNGKEFNVTIENIGNSLLNATIARIVVRFGNETVFQGEGIGYVVEVGKNATLAFSWDWSDYKTKEVTISVYTAESLEFFNTFII